MKKSGHNKFAGYHYFELGDFLNPINVIFNELGLCGITTFTAEVATLTIYDVEDGSNVSFTSPMGSAALKGCHEVQNIGAVETYQRRYLYVVALEIVEHDALESVAGKPETGNSVSAKSVPESLSDSRYEDLFNAISAAEDINAIKALLKSAVNSNATKSQLEALQANATKSKEILTRKV